MARCLIGCGSNLGRRRDLLDRAMELLGCMPGVSLRAVSHYRETVPVGGPPGQPAFLNAACLIDTDLPPAGVLEILAAVERTLQRERTERWAARTIDLDLLLYDDVVLDTPDLTIPHPRMATRRFVLEPAAEIAGEIAFPPTGCTVRDLLDNISAPHPLVAVIGVPGSGASEIASAVADAVELAAPSDRRGLRQRRCRADLRGRLHRRLDEGDEPRPVRPGGEGPRGRDGRRQPVNSVATQ